MSNIKTDHLRPPEDEVTVYWLGGAGFVIKAKSGTIGIDLFLSDMIRDGEIYKRLTLPPIEARELSLDVLIASHEHPDHLDSGSLNDFINNNTATYLLGPKTMHEEALRLGIPKNRVIRLDREDLFDGQWFSLRAVKADHGNLSLDAIGVIIKVAGVNLYFTGDTCYKPTYNEMIGLKEQIDILMVPINSTYGNPGPDGAAYIAESVHTDMVIPCHYWLFKEHGGDPGAFIESCSKIAPSVRPVVLAVGEGIVYQKNERYSTS